MKTGLLLLGRDEELLERDEDAEGLKNQALARLGSQGKELMEGHWAAKASRGTLRGHRGRGTYGGGAPMGEVHSASSAPCV